uniref:Uncharacterized protein n=1 Tax=Knipowitschia caucasica TaxID=637954 RepID=A0AAV2LM54_KNICA
MYREEKPRRRNSVWTPPVCPLPLPPRDPSALPVPATSQNSCARWVPPALLMVSPTIKAVVDALWAVWSIGASIYDYINTGDMEERVHALERLIVLHECAIGLLSAGVCVLFTYVLFRNI